MSFLGSFDQNWTLSDLKDLVSSEREESVNFELKRDLPLADGATGWRKKRSLHASERDGLAKEIVAFANTYGGTIIVGIHETKDAPKRSAALGQPLPEIYELVDRLRSSFAAYIDPPIRFLDVLAIPLDEASDEGFVVINVPPSITKPHGVGRPPLVYIRRDDKSEPATMRDMHNLYWETRTDRERIAVEIERKKQILDDLVPQGDINFQFIAIASQPLVLPQLVRSIREQRVFRNPGNYSVRNIADAAEFPTNVQRWKPTAFGVEFNEGRSDSTELANVWEIDETGIVSVTSSRLLSKHQHSDSKTFYPGWYTKTAGTILALADIISRWSGYGGSWVFSARFDGANDLLPLSDERFRSHGKIDLGRGISIRSLVVGDGLPDDDLSEVADRIWAAFGVVRPAEDESIKYGIAQTLQFDAAG